MIETVRQVPKEVQCPNCNNLQTEQVSLGDKYAFVCHECGAAIEGGSLHLLQEQAVYTAKRGGNVCTGFGGRAGAIAHKRY